MRRMVSEHDGEVLHDYFASREGGGTLALTLAGRWGWPVTGGFITANFARHVEGECLELRQLDVRPSHRLLRPLSLTRVWQRYQSRAATVIYSGTYTPLAAGNQPGARNVLYCHSPPRFVYDQRAFYLRSVPVWQRPALWAFIRYLKPRYERAVGNMGVIISNSENVRRRVRTYLGRDSIVVHPPCRVESFYWREPENYYLSTARLDPLKRVDVVIAAFKRLPAKKLVVVSDGPDRRRLERLASGADNIAFAGEVSDDRLRALMAECIATIYVPRQEDFGMSAVESMAAGKPVIGVSEGGLLEIVVDGETGILLPPDPQPDHLIAAVSSLTAAQARAMRQACERRSMRFTSEEFISNMGRVASSA